MAPKTTNNKQNGDQKTVNAKKKKTPSSPQSTPETIQEKIVVTETTQESSPIEDKKIAEVNDEPSDIIVVETKFTDVLEKLQTITTGIKYIMTEVKTLQKEYSKAKKATKKKRGVNPNAKRSPSGFAKPTPLDDALADFLGVPKGTQKSRTEVTKSINEYIKKNNLQEPADKRLFNPDKKLSTILNVAPGQNPSYFNLQQLIKGHFKKESEI